MAAPDKVFKQAYDWFRESIDQALSGLPAAQRLQVEPLLEGMLGLTTSPAPATPDSTNFKDIAAVAESLAYALQIVSEGLVALDYLQEAVKASSPAPAVVNQVLDYVGGILQPGSGKSHPSALNLAKILLTLSGDSRDSAPVAGQSAKKLAQLLGAASAPQVQSTQAALGLLTLLVGCLIDRTFAGKPDLKNLGWSPLALPPMPSPPQLNLSGPAGLGGSLKFLTGGSNGVEADLNLALASSPGLDGSSFAVTLTSTAGGQLFVPLQPPGPAQAAADFELALKVARSKNGGTVVLGHTGDATVSVRELGIEVVLSKSKPSLLLFARDCKASLTVPPGILSTLLGNGVDLDFSLEAAADQFGRLRLKNGTGLKASLPVPTMPTGPFTLQLINFELRPASDTNFLKLGVDLSASFGLSLGPFQGSVEGMGVSLNLDGARPPDFGFKWPSGIGLSLDAGVVKGGGYLAFNADRTEFAGTLELKLMAIDVKAIAILSTTPGVGYSLLLLIYGQFPPIQLSFGFVLTGVGGLIGVQHTADTNALSLGLGNGSLDAILFPENPVGDAPRIISTLRSLFPIRAGGFIIGPMLELGWGTPSLVIVRLGLLIEANQFLILGQAIVQLPPLIDADLSLLRLEVDLLGYVVFDPLRLGFDAKLRNSHVAFLSITGQFAFRATFGDHPTFLISAGGFHPRFKEVPSDIPVPFDRVGTSFDIGFVGVDFKGYFAITSATVQAGSDLRLWADIGVADIAGGWGFDAICYLEPKFYFEVDMHAYVTVHVLGEDFAGVRVDGTLAGPGCWHIAGRGTLELPLVPDIHINIDQTWGTDQDTPAVTITLADRVKQEIEKTSNWSAQLPAGGEGFVTLADIKGITDLLAHPLGSLTFQQRLIPLELRLNKVSGSRIADANEYSQPAMKFGEAAAQPNLQPVRDFFAAAQFLDMSQDDKISKPSFEEFPAGYVLRDDSYEAGEMVSQELSYEEFDLGRDPGGVRSRFLSATPFLEHVHGPLMQFGAAGRSVLRDKQLMQPDEKVPLQVNPAPLTVVNKDTLGIAAGATVKHSYWQSRQILTDSKNINPRQNQIAEVAELV